MVSRIEIENTKRALERLSKNTTEKIPRVENSENVFNRQGENVEERNRFKSEVSPPGEVPYYKKKKIPKKLNGLDKYLIFAFTSLIVFTIAVLVVFIFTREEPAVLVGCFFAAFGGEILMCALIKRLKLHKEAEIKKEDKYGT